MRAWYDTNVQSKECGNIVHSVVRGPLWKGRVSAPIIIILLRTYQAH